MKVLSDLIKSHVKCIHGKRPKKCLICRIKFDGRMREGIQAFTRHQELTDAILNIVYSELRRQETRSE